ncbi:MAG: class I SAM-dependent methyltransferase [Acidimicrobiia bacterium]
MADPTPPDPNTDPSSHPNSEQREYWNGADSREWVDEMDRYDEMLAPFGARVLDVAGLAPGARVLDVGCGNGATTLAASARVAPGGQALGIDLSAPMLANARARAEGQGLGNVRFEVADAQTAELGGPFDSVISRFGVMFFDDPDAACRNLVGSLGPGGRLAFVCWRGAIENEWVAVQAAAALAHAPVSQEQLVTDGPGPFRYADPAPLVGALERVGLTDVAADPFDTRVLLGGYGSLDDVMQFIGNSGMTRRLLADASPEQRASAVDAMRGALAPFETADGVSLGAAAWTVTGRRR